MIAQSFLQAGSAREALEACAPGLAEAIDQAVAEAQVRLAGLDPEASDQVLPDTMRAVLRSRMSEARLREDVDVQFESRNGIRLVLGDDRLVQLRILRAHSSTGAPAVAQSRTRREEWAQDAFELGDAGPEIAALSLVLTWDVTPAGVELVLSLPSVRSTSRYASSVHWSIPVHVPEPIVDADVEETPYPEDLDGYQRRQGKAEDEDDPA